MDHYLIIKQLAEFIDNVYRDLNGIVAKLSDNPNCPLAYVHLGALLNSVLHTNNQLAQFRDKPACCDKPCEEDNGCTEGE